MTAIPVRMASETGMTDQFSIRTMGASELDIAIGWAESEGWNPGRGDRDAFLAADADGFLMGFLGDEPVTAISVVRYGPAFGFLGFYICRPDQRGKGLGWRTWQAGLERLEGRTVGLDGVVAQQDNYRRSGFVLEHRNIRFAGAPVLPAPADPRLVRVAGGNVAGVIAFDTGFFPAPRPRFLEAWLDGKGGRRAYALIANGAIEGYGVIRPAVSGFKIGPLFARTAEGADVLFRALAAEAGGETIIIDCPEPNAAAQSLAARYALSPAFETARMYRGTALVLPLDSIFGITSFELG